MKRKTSITNEPPKKRKKEFNATALGNLFYARSKRFIPVGIEFSDDEEWSLDRTQMEMIDLRDPNAMSTQSLMKPKPKPIPNETKKGLHVISLLADSDEESKPPPPPPTATLASNLPAKTSSESSPLDLLAETATNTIHLCFSMNTPSKYRNIHWLKKSIAKRHGHIKRAAFWWHQTTIGCCVLLEFKELRSSKSVMFDSSLTMNGISISCVDSIESCEGHEFPPDEAKPKSCIKSKGLSKTKKAVSLVPHKDRVKKQVEKLVLGYIKPELDSRLSNGDLSRSVYRSLSKKICNKVWLSKPNWTPENVTQLKAEPEKKNIMEFLKKYLDKYAPVTAQTGEVEKKA